MSTNLKTQVYSLGSNGSGQLGIGHNEDVSVPKEVLFEDECPAGVTQIRAGGNHTLLLSGSGKLFVSGNYSSGACGIRSSGTPVIGKFRTVQLDQDHSRLDSKTVLCAATWEASFIVQENEEGGHNVYSFGTGDKGELGLGEFITRTHAACLVQGLPTRSTIKGLAASVGHVVVVLDDGSVYGWGNGRKEQLGKPAAIVREPRKIDGLDFKVARAVCGKDFTYLEGEKDTGRHLLLGSDRWNVKASTFAVAAEEWRDIGASWGNLYALTKAQRLVSWGRNDHGQQTPPNLPLVTDIAIGSEHALAISESGDVLAWGWGEHGNCGPVEAPGDVRGVWKVVASSKYLPDGCTISGIGAGCATSWIVTSRHSS